MGWIDATHQTWKLVVFVGWMLVAGLFILLLVASVQEVRWTPIGAVESAFGLVASGALALAWLLVSIRCPACGTRPVWRVLRTAEAHEWVKVLVSYEQCPACGDRGDRRGMPS